jgi:cytidine deaminase
MEITQEEKVELIQRALEVRQLAYAPYSNFTVGAALLTESGDIFHGVNVENASYPLCMCAERNAVFKSISRGHKKFKAIVVATENGGSPCGACRQVLSEFGLHTLVITVNGEGKPTLETTVGDLLPAAFRPQDLQTE